MDSRLAPMSAPYRETAASDSGGACGSACAPALPAPPSTTAKWLGAAILLLLPWLLLALNANWPFQSVGRMDPWYYFGHFIHFPQYQRVAPTYAGERLPWILPGWLLVHLLSPLWGTLVLHVLFYYLGVFAIYRLVWGLANWRSGLLTAVLLGCHSFFIAANASEYVDGACIAYLSLALLCVRESRQSRHRRWWWLLSGVCAGLLFYTYLFYIVLTPCLVLLFLGGCGLRQSPQPLRHGLRQLTSFALFFLLGLGLVTLLMMGMHLAIVGHPDFLRQSISMVRRHGNQESSPWATNDNSFVLTATWLVFPALAAFGCLGWLIGRSWRRTPETGNVTAVAAMCLAAIGVMVYFTFRGLRVLEFDYFAHVLLPPVFLFLGTAVWRVPNSLSNRAFAVWLLLAGAACLGPLAMVGSYSLALRYGLAPHYLIGLAAVVVWLRGRTANIAWSLRLGCLVVASMGLLPLHQSLAWRNRYDGWALVRRVSSAIQYIHGKTPSGQVPYFWIARQDPEYRAIMCGFVSHAYSMQAYPQLDEKRRYKPGTLLVLATAGQDAFDSANTKMTNAGMPLELLEQKQIADGGRAYWLTLTRVRPAPPPSTRPFTPKAPSPAVAP